MALYIPSSLFAGFTSSDLFTFTTTQNNYDNGGEEWIRRATGTFLPPECPITDNGQDCEVVVVPEPTTLALFGIGLAGLGFARRKKKSA